MYLVDIHCTMRSSRCSAACSPEMKRNGTEWNLRLNGLNLIPRSALAGPWGHCEAKLLPPRCQMLLTGTRHIRMVKPWFSAVSPIFPNIGISPHSDCLPTSGTGWNSVETYSNCLNDWWLTRISTAKGVTITHDKFRSCSSCTAKSGPI